MEVEKREERLIAHTLTASGTRPKAVDKSTCMCAKKMGVERRCPADCGGVKQAAQRRPSLIRTHGLQPAKYDHFMSSSGVKSPAASVATGDPRTKRTHTGKDCSGWP